MVYRDIQFISQSAPVRITVPTDGLPDGWRVAISNCKGMPEINAVANEIIDSDYHQVTVIDTLNIDLNDINAVGFKPYQSGGVLQFNTPVDMDGFTARMQIRDKIGGKVLFTLDTASGGIAIDNIKRTITLNLSATTTAGITTWKKGVYELEMTSATGEVTSLLSGSVAVIAEITLDSP